MNLMKMIILLMMIFFMLIILINKINMKKMKMNFMNTIECGFNQMNNKHISMSNNFFFIMMIFLIFDMEFFLMIPLIIMIKNFNWIKFNLMMLLILIFIYFSMIYEIKINCIKWIK